LVLLVSMPVSLRKARAASSSSLRMRVIGTSRVWCEITTAVISLASPFSCSTLTWAFESGRR